MTFTMKPTPRGITFCTISLWLALSAFAAFAQDQQATTLQYDIQREEEDINLLDANEILDTPVTLNFRDAALQDVLRLIAVKSNLNIIMNPQQVQGNVTFRLENVKLGVALRNILRVNGLAYITPDAENENIVRIVPASDVQADAVETKTETIQINWVAASDVAQALQGFLSDAGSVYPDQATQTIILTDVPQRMESHKRIIKQLDRSERQVLIEARFVDMKTDATRDLGIDLSIWEDDGSGNSPGASVSSSIPAHPGFEELAMGFASAQSPAALAFGDTIGILGRDFDVAGLITAFENRDIAEVLANPRVMTINNVPASIEMRTQIPYLETGNADNSGSEQDTNPIQEYKFEPVGIKVEVLPTITPNNYVRLNLVTSQDIFAGQPGGSLSRPQIDERNAETNVIVKSEETVFVGGLRQLTIQDETEGVPWFRNIPVLGWLFKGKTNRQDKKDLFLFVTPHVIDEPMLTTEESSLYKRIDVKWDLPDYFFDDVKVDEDMD